MPEEYNRERIDQLIKEAREITAHLRAETEKIKAEMARVVDGEDEADVNEPDGEKAALDASILAEIAPKKSSWWRWR